MATSPALAVDTAAGAVIAALDYHCPQESRTAAIAFLESLKNGDIQVLGVTASALVKQSSLAAEVRHYGLKLLQHLVRMRWEELSNENRLQLVDMIFEIIPEVITPHNEWVLKSQTAALLAEVMRHEGTSMWQELLRKLSQMSDASPSHAELIVTVLRWLPEDITVYNEDLEGGRRRELLHSLTEYLPQILPLVYKVLEFHFGNAVNFMQQGDIGLAQQHVAVVMASLNAVLAYVEWAPVDKMAEWGLIQACGFLLNVVDFRLRAGEFFKKIAMRKRPNDEVGVAYDAAMVSVFEILANIQSLLLGANEDDIELLECVSEAMIAFGVQNLQSIAAHQDYVTKYLEQMLWLFQQEKTSIHFSVLLFWLAVLRDTQTDFASSEDLLIKEKLGLLVPAAKEKKGFSVVISDEVYFRLLDLSFHWFFTKSLKAPQAGAAKTANSTMDEDMVHCSDYGNYRGRLLDMVRLVALQRPFLAVGKVSERVSELCRSFMDSECMVWAIENLQKLLEATIHTIFGGHEIPMPNIVAQVEGLIGMLLSTKWDGVGLVEVHGRLLDAMGPFLKVSSGSMLAVLNKIFELLMSIPLVPKGVGTDEARIEISRARLQVCSSFLRIAKAAGKAVAAHMEAIWRTVMSLQDQGLLQQGEHKLIAEGFLIAGAAAGKAFEEKVLDCFLKPLQENWIQNNWQSRFFLHVDDLVALLTLETVGHSQNGELWSIFHSVTFIERVLKRCGGDQDRTIPHEEAPSEHVTTMPFSHPIMNHLMWTVPSVLKVIQCLHALCSPAVRSTLPSVMQESLVISAAERASLLGESGSFSETEMNSAAATGTASKESQIRNWLKGVRDSGYSIVGLTATHFPHLFFEHMDSNVVQAALLENIEGMELRHIRSLLHFIVIPIIKSCPVKHRGNWLGKLMPELVMFCEQKLSLGWNNLSKGQLVEPGARMKFLQLWDEVLQEKVLRDLSREMCLLLAVMASPALNPNFPPGDQLLQSGQVGLPEKLGPTLLGSECLLGFVMQNYQLAKSSISICVQALRWPDSEAVHKALIFCGAVSTVAAVFRDGQLQDFVARDMFTAVIEALTMDSNASAQAELISLFRLIYLLLAHHPAPRQVLLSSPLINEDDVSAFENALGSTSSAKDQKQFIKSLLLQAGGNNLKALIAFKSPTLITNVTNRRSKSASQDEESAQIGLATII